jgi:GT2 family glycosyltransferase
VELICGSAQEFEPDERVTAYYFFNPFPASVLRGVLKRIGGHSVRLFCYYPDDEWVELLLSQGWTLSESVDLRDALGKDARERVDIFDR